MTGTAGRGYTLAPDATDDYYAALRAGPRWNVENFSPDPGIITFSFPADGSYYGAYVGGSNEHTTGFAEFTAQMKLCARQAFLDLGRLLNVTFTEITEDASTHATVRLAQSSVPSSAYANYPSNAVYGGDCWFKNGSYTDPQPGNYPWYTIYHEIGHALGMKHAHVAPAMPTDHWGMSFSLMSYAQGLTDNPPDGFVDSSKAFPHTYMMDDVRTLQAWYGIASSDGNTTFVFDKDAGIITVAGVDRPDNAGTNQVYFTVNDSGGTDTLDFSEYTDNETISLVKQAWSNFSAAQLGNVFGSENAPGNIAIGSNTVIENVVTGSGDDTITGNSADNAIDANSGADSYVVTGNNRDYNIIKTGGVVKLIDARDGAPDGADTLINVESIVFSDGTVSVASIATGHRTKIKFVVP